MNLRLTRKERLIAFLIVGLALCVLPAWASPPEDKHEPINRQPITGSTEHPATFGMDFTPYMSDVQRRIKRAWFPPQGMESLPVILLFKVHSEGEISDLRIQRSSGRAIVDQAAVQAVMNAAPFRPLPPGTPSAVDIEFPFPIMTSLRGLEPARANPPSEPAFGKTTVGSEHFPFTIETGQARPVTQAKKNLPVTPPKGEFESYDYPYIKWKPKMLSSGIPMQLETTIEEPNSEYRPGMLKYKVLVLLKGSALLPSQGITIELLDDKGFDLGKFMVPGSEFGAMPGTSVLEARGKASFSEEDYRKAADYFVK